MNTADTHYVANGVPTCNCRPGKPDLRWQTPDPYHLHALRERMLESEVKELSRVIRKWEINFLIVCTQFAVVAVAAVWGWAR